jgi:protoheme IX farnesyltransferase
VYLAGAVLLGAWFLRGAMRFTASRTVGQARHVLRVSLLYLPGLLLLLIVDRSLGLFAR